LDRPLSTEGCTRHHSGRTIWPGEAMAMNVDLPER